MGSRQLAAFFGGMSISEQNPIVSNSVFSQKSASRCAWTCSGGFRTHSKGRNTFEWIRNPPDFGSHSAVVCTTSPEFRRLGRSWVDQLRQEFLWVRNATQSEATVSCRVTSIPPKMGQESRPQGWESRPGGRLRACGSSVRSTFAIFGRPAGGENPGPETTFFPLS